MTHHELEVGGESHSCGHCCDITPDEDLGAVGPGLSTPLMSESMGNLLFVNLL